MHRHHATTTAIAIIALSITALVVAADSAEAAANTDPAIELIPVDIGAFEWTSSLSVSVDLWKQTPKNLVGCYVHEDDSTPETHRLKFIRSTNLGRSWTITNVENDADTDDPGCAVASYQDDLYLFYRNNTYTGPDEETTQDDTGALNALRSTNNGATWTVTAVIAGPNDGRIGSAIDVGVYSNGTLTLVTADQDHNNIVFQSHDRGETWRNIREFDVGADGPNAQPPPDGARFIDITVDGEAALMIDDGGAPCAVRYTVDNFLTTNGAGCQGGVGSSISLVPGSNNTLWLGINDGADASLIRKDNIRTSFDNTNIATHTGGDHWFLTVNNETRVSNWVTVASGSGFCNSCLFAAPYANGFSGNLLVDDNALISTISTVALGLDGGGALYHRPGSNTGDPDDTGGIYFALMEPTVTQVNNSTGFTRITKVETDYENTPTVYVRDNGGTSGDSTLSKFTANLGSGFEATECVTPYQESGFVEVGLAVTTDAFVAHPCEVDPDDDGFFFNSVILGRNRNLGVEEHVETCNRATDLASSHAHRVAWIAQSQFLNDNCSDDDEELFGVVSLVSGAQVCNGATAVGQAIRVSTNGLADTKWFFTHGPGGLSQYNIDQCTLQGGDSNIGGFGVAHLPYNRGDPTNVSDDGEVVAHDSGNDEIVHYNVTTDGQLEVLERINVGDGTPYNSVLGLSGSKDGAYFMSWTTDNATIWSTETDQVVVHLEWGPQEITDLIRWVEMDVLNNNLYVANDTELRVYDVSAFTDAFGVDNDGPNTGPDPFSNPFLEQETGQQAADADGSSGGGGDTGTGGTLLDPSTPANVFGVDEGLGALFLAVLVVLGIVGLVYKFTDSEALAGTVGGVGGLMLAFSLNLVPEWVMAFIFAVIVAAAVLLMRGI